MKYRHFDPLKDCLRPKDALDLSNANIKIPTILLPLINQKDIKCLHAQLPVIE
jgi:hypothetical protein